MAVDAQRPADPAGDPADALVLNGAQTRESPTPSYQVSVPHAAESEDC